jgi:hypothetical protein
MLFISPLFLNHFHSIFITFTFQKHRLWLYVYYIYIHISIYTHLSIIYAVSIDLYPCICIYIVIILVLLASFYSYSFRIWVGILFWSLLGKIINIFYAYHKFVYSLVLFIILVCLEAMLINTYKDGKSSFPNCHDLKTSVFIIFQYFSLSLKESNVFIALLGIFTFNLIIKKSICLPCHYFLNFSNTCSHFYVLWHCTFLTFD